MQFPWLPLFPLGDMKDEDSNQLELSPLSNLRPYLTFRHHEAELSLSMENEDSF